MAVSPIWALAHGAIFVHSSMAYLASPAVSVRGTMPKKTISIGCLLLAIPNVASAQDKVDEAMLAEMQKNFVAAYNRGDTEVMANTFTANAIRVTPSGIFQGRDAIRGSFQIAVTLGMHDYSVNRTISMSEGKYVFNIGTWQGKLGDHPFHGFYTAMVVREDGQAKIVQETVTVAAPQ